MRSVRLTPREVRQMTPVSAPDAESRKLQAVALGARLRKKAHQARRGKDA
jgi:hypothetical protein